MIILLALVFFGVLGWYVFYLLTDFRRAILAGVIFTSLSVFAVPWHIFPFWGIHAALKLGFIGVAFLCFFGRGSFEQVKPYVLSHYNIALWALWLLLFGYLMLAPDSEYGLMKAVRFFDKCILPVLAILVLAPFDRKDLAVILNTLIVAGILMTLSYLSFGNVFLQRATVGDFTGPITIGRIIGMGAAAALVIFLTKSNKKNITTLLYVLGFLALSFALLMVGSRGPVMGLAVTLVAVLLVVQLGVKDRTITIASFAFIVFVPVASLFFIGADFQILRLGGFDRVVSSLGSIGEHRNDMVRIEMYGTAWRGFLGTAGLGSGTGSFSDLHFADYPHNIVMELAYEQGIPGLSILGFILVSTLLRVRKVVVGSGLDEYGKALFGLWVFAFLNASVSFDVTENYIFWISTALLWCATETTGKTAKVPGPRPMRQAAGLRPFPGRPMMPPPPRHMPSHPMPPPYRVPPPPGRFGVPNPR
ncbi:MAG: O-antigen ligase family protein [Opitutales bacterium]